MLCKLQCLLNDRARGIPAVLSRGIPGKALRAFPGSFRKKFWNFLRKVPAVLGAWPTRRFPGSQSRGRNLARGDQPNCKKTLRECRGKGNSFGWVRSNSGNRSESCSENCDSRIAQVVRCHSENGMSHSENYFLNSESCSENTREVRQLKP